MVYCHTTTLMCCLVVTGPYHHLSHMVLSWQYHRVLDVVRELSSSYTSTNTQKSIGINKRVQSIQGTGPLYDCISLPGYFPSSITIMDTQRLESSSFLVEGIPLDQSDDLDFGLMKVFHHEMLVRWNSIPS